MASPGIVSTSRGGINGGRYRRKKHVTAGLDLFFFFLIAFLEVAAVTSS